MSVGVIGLTVVALTATTAAHADDPIMNPQPIAAACKGCPNGGPCGNPAPACTANGNATCNGGANLCTDCMCQSTRNGCVCQ